MHRTVRMLGILLDLQASPTTIGRLADTYACSRKTIQRDLAALVDLEIPIRSTSGATGGVSLDPAWSMSPMNLSPEEIETVVIALENASYLPAAETTLAKIRNAAKPDYFDSIATSPQRPKSRSPIADEMPASVAKIRNIMARGLWCRMDYSGGSTPGWRVILPKALRILEGRWYLHAIDERSRDNRIFRLDRIRDLHPSLAPPEADDVIETAINRPAYQSEQYPEIDVELTPAGIEFCRDHSHFHHSLAGNRLAFRCPPGEYRYVARELMRMGTDCRVIAPPELIQQLEVLVAEISEHIASNKVRRLS